MNLDSLASTRAIHSPVETPGEIEGSFDAIAYEKGAAVMRMIEGYLGRRDLPQRRQRLPGAARVRQRHVRGLLDRDDGRVRASRSIASCRRSSTSRACRWSTSRFDVRRRRSQRDADERALLHRCGDGASWFAPRRRGRLPICIKTPPAERRRRVRSSAAAGDRLALDGSHRAHAWAFVNAGAHGYFRTAYSPAMLQRDRARHRDRA